MFQWLGELGNTFAFFNSEVNIGVNLVVFEDEEKGLYEIKLEFPPEYRRVNFENQDSCSRGLHAPLQQWDPYNCGIGRRGLDSCYNFKLSNVQCTKDLFHFIN